MKEQKNTDFFPEIDAQDEVFVAVENYEPYVDSEEDILHEERLKEIEEQIEENLGARDSDEDLGELPYDAETDRKRWDELEKDFDRVFDEAEKE